MNTRLKQFLAAENITQAQFADSINVVRASVSHVLSGRNNPSFDFIKAMMLQYPNLNIDWLMFGKGKMYKDNRAPETRTPVEDILFPPEPIEEVLTDDSSLNSGHDNEELANITSSIEFKTLNNTIQSPVNQRKVTKIIVLFDDGTFQEM
jgi:transcriptional regulator with XRE-family HTH domain